MCQTITTYACLHRVCEHSLCHSYIAKLRKAQNAPPSRPSFWRSLLCVPCSSSSSYPSSSIHCTQRPGERTVFTKCPDCFSQDTMHLAQKAREIEHRIAMAQEAHNRAEKARLEARRRSDRKEAFRCSKCASERRRPDQMTRAANGGLCCAWASEEFEKLEPERGFVAPPRRNHGDFTDAPRAAPQPSLEQRFPKLRYMTSTEKVRDEAKVAANTYGWDRRRKGSVALEPGLVSEFVSIAGVGTTVLNTAPVPGKPKYEDLGIDYALWKQMQDVKLGYHRRAPPPPEKPLPICPLQLKQKKQHQIPRKPVASYPVSPVSPLSPQSGPKDKHTLRTQASIMNGELRDMIDDVILDFQPINEQRYKY